MLTNVLVLGDKFYMLILEHTANAFYENKTECIFLEKGFEEGNPNNKLCELNDIFLVFYLNMKS